MSEETQPTGSQNASGISKELTTQLYQKVIDIFANRATIYESLAEVTTDEEKKSSLLNDAYQNAHDAEQVRQEAQRRGLPIIEVDDLNSL